MSLPLYICYLSDCGSLGDCGSAGFPFLFVVVRAARPKASADDTLLVRHAGERGSN